LEDPAVESNDWQSRVVLTDIKDLSIGNGYFCYINTSGVMWCGGNSTKYKADLKPVLDQTVVEVSAKSSNGPACARTDMGDVYCVEDPINPEKPQFVGFEKVDEMPQAVSIAAGNEFVCGILSTGETTCKTIGLSISSTL
jgi:hypothetical protein